MNTQDDKAVGMIFCIIGLILLAYLLVNLGLPEAPVSITVGLIDAWLLVKMFG